MILTPTVFVCQTWAFAVGLRTRSASGEAGALDMGKCSPCVSLAFASDYVLTLGSLCQTRSVATPEVKRYVGATCLGFWTAVLVAALEYLGETSGQVDWSEAA